MITTYDTLKSEYGVFNPGDGQRKAKTKKQVASDDDSDSSEAEHFGRTLKKSAKKTTKAKKDALYHMQWFRVILGEDGITQDKMHLN